MNFGSASTGFSFGASSSAPSNSSGFSFGASSAAPTTGFSFGASSSAPSTGFAFGSSSAPSTGFAFGSTTASTAPTTTTGFIGFGASSSVPTTTSFGGFGASNSMSVGSSVPSLGFCTTAPASTFGFNSTQPGQVDGLIRGSTKFDSISDANPIKKNLIAYDTKLRNDRNDASTIEELLKNMQEIVSPSPENLNDRLNVLLGDLANFSSASSPLNNLRSQVSRELLHIETVSRQSNARALEDEERRKKWQQLSSSGHVGPFVQHPKLYASELSTEAPSKFYVEKEAEFKSRLHNLKNQFFDIENYFSNARQASNYDPATIQDIMRTQYDTCLGMGLKIHNIDVQSEKIKSDITSFRKKVLKDFSDPYRKSSALSSAAPLNENQTLVAQVATVPTQQLSGFGNTGFGVNTTTFGASSSTFGNSTFGSTNSSFGSTNLSFGSTGGFTGGFGTAPTTTGFGAPASNFGFGSVTATPSTQPSNFSLAPSPSTSTSTGGGLFSTPTTSTSTFGSSASSGFGGFGSSTSFSAPASQPLNKKKTGR